MYPSGKEEDYNVIKLEQQQERNMFVVVLEWRRKGDDIGVMELEWRQEKRLRTPTTRGFDARAVMRETNFPMTSRR